MNDELGGIYLTFTLVGESGNNDREPEKSDLKLKVRSYLSPKCQS